MSSSPDPAPVTPPHLATLDFFSSYALGLAYDEMFDAQGQPRPQYEALYDRLQEAGADVMHERQSAADLAFLHQGITFTVYGKSEGTERIFPYDLIPRIITAAEWDVLERGLTQRITALNLFLKDVYTDARVLADGVVPRELVYSCKHFRREMQGVHVRHDVYVSVAASIWCACLMARLRCSRTTCGCRAGSATCSPTGRSSSACSRCSSAATMCGPWTTTARRCWRRCGR